MAIVLYFPKQFVNINILSSSASGFCNDNIRVLLGSIRAKRLVAENVLTFPLF